MDEKIILALGKSDYDKADKIWVEIYNNEPRSVGELLVLVDRLIDRDHADESIVKDERLSDAILALEPRYSGDILLNLPFVIAEKDKFIDENDRWLNMDGDDIYWENSFDVYNSGGYEVATIKIVLKGKILADGITFYRGYYEDCPESYYEDDSISEYFYSAFEWEGQTPSVDDITVYGEKKEKPEVSEKARQWEERWHKRSEVSQRSSLDKRARNFNSAKDYIDYLTGTYIPDLIESGKEGTAGDFKEIIKLIRKGKDRLDENDRIFMRYIERVMIPDLKESENEFTAEDYQEGLDWIQEPEVEKTRQWEERWRKRSSIKLSQPVPRQFPFDPAIDFRFIEEPKEFYDGTVESNRLDELSESEYEIYLDIMAEHGVRVHFSMDHDGYVVEPFQSPEKIKEEISEKTRKWEERWRKKSSLDKQAYTFSREEDYKDFPNGNRISHWVNYTADDRTHVRTQINYIEITLNGELLWKTTGKVTVHESIEAAKKYMELCSKEAEKSSDKARTWEERWHKKSELEHPEIQIGDYVEVTKSGFYVVYPWRGPATSQVHVKAGETGKVSIDFKKTFVVEFPDGRSAYIYRTYVRSVDEKKKVERWEERWHKRSELNKVGLNVGDRIPVNPGEYNTVVIADDGRILDYGRTYKIDRPETGIIYDKLQVGGGAAAIAWVYIVKLYELYLMIDAESAPVSPETIRWEERWHKRSKSLQRSAKVLPTDYSSLLEIIEERYGEDSKSWADTWLEMSYAVSWLEKEGIVVDADSVVKTELIKEYNDLVLNMNNVDGKGQEIMEALAKTVQQKSEWMSDNDVVEILGDAGEISVIFDATTERALVDQGEENIKSPVDIEKKEKKIEEWQERWHKRSSIKTALTGYPKGFHEMLNWIQHDEEYGYDMAHDIYEFQTTSFALDWADQEVPCFAPYEHDVRKNLIAWYRESILPTLGPRGEDIMSAVSEGWAYNGNIQVAEILKIIESYAGIKIDYDESTNTYTCVDVDPSARTRSGKQFPPIQEKTRQWEERWHKHSELDKKPMWTIRDKNPLDPEEQYIGKFDSLENAVNSLWVGYWSGTFFESEEERASVIDIPVADKRRYLETHGYEFMEIGGSEKTRQWEERWHKKSQQKYMPIGGTYWQATFHNEYFKYDNFYPKLELVSRATEWAMIIGENMRANRGGKAFIKGGFVTDRGDYKVAGIDGPDGVELGTVLVPENHLTDDKENLQDDKTRQWEERWHKRSSMDKKAFFRVWNNNTESPIHIPSQAITLEQFIEDAWRVLGPAGHETETPEGKYSLLYNKGYIIQNIPDTSRLEAPETEKTREWEQRWHKRSSLKKKSDVSQANIDKFEQMGWDMAMGTAGTGWMKYDPSDFNPAGADMSSEIDSGLVEEQMMTDARNWFDTNQWQYEVGQEIDEIVKKGGDIWTDPELYDRMELQDAWIVGYVGAAMELVRKKDEPTDKTREWEERWHKRSELAQV